MIVYKIDKQSHYRSNTRVKEMDSVLREIPTTLHILAEILEEHAEAISSPSINDYRGDLHQRIREAITATSKIVEDSQRLIAVSDQAGKHLSAIEEHFGASLRNPVQTQPAKQLV